MPRKHKRRSMKGGFWGFGDDTTSGAESSVSSWWNKAKGSVTGASASTPPYTPASTPPYTPPPAGGKSRKRRRHKGGGFHSNTPTTGLATHAASFSGSTAKPHSYVGGRKMPTQRIRTNRRMRVTRSRRMR